MTHRANHDLVEVAGEIQEPGTEKAFRFTAEGQTFVWLPRSQCEWDEQAQEMSMPEWLAQEKGLI